MDVIFVADAYPEHLNGGAELSLQALIDTSPMRIHKILGSQLKVADLKQNVGKYWVFGNYTFLNPQLLSLIAANCRYSVVEFDYKFCKHRSLEKHLTVEGSPCDCQSSQSGKLVMSFLAGADQVFWMSETQREIHHKAFPQLADYPQTVLGSVFDDRFFERIASLRGEQAAKDPEWLVLQHSSWIKGTDEAVSLATREGLPCRLIGNVSYDEMLLALSRAKGLIFTPVGGDTCPRLVIEAKLLGCELRLNSNVQHAKEAWFDTDDLAAVEDYLRAAPGVFWRAIKKQITRDHTLSGYATTYNCVDQEYPFEECISSMLGFCDEVVVVDAGSTDETLARLGALQVKYGDGHTTSYSSHNAAFADMNPHSRLQVFIVERDWNDPRSALFDGMQKAEARQRCTGDFVWQMDVDEVVRKEDYAKVRALVRDFPKVVPMLSLPVVEYWGGLGKVRLDVNPWKWRMSRNSPRITHGVPAQLRGVDQDGRMIAMPGTDGCDPIDANTGEPIVFLGFLTPEMEQARRQALDGDVKALQAYEGWLTRVIANVPSVFHASWLDIERKAKTYKRFWQRHWRVLNGDDSGDTAENNFFFDKPWADVSDEEISAKAKELAEGTGGHVFHTRWDGARKPHMTLAGVSPPVEFTQLRMTSSELNSGKNEA